MEEGSFESTNTERMAEGMRVEMCVREEDSMRQWLEDGQGVWGGDGFWNLVNRGRCYKVLHVCGLKKYPLHLYFCLEGFKLVGAGARLQWLKMHEVGMGGTREVRKVSIDSFLKFLCIKEEWEKLCVKRDDRIERKQENKKVTFFGWFSFK